MVVPQPHNAESDTERPMDVVPPTQSAPEQQPEWLEQEPVNPKIMVVAVVITAIVLLAGVFMAIQYVLNS